MHKALYRTYRPEFFKDVVGQIAPTRVLRNAITKEEFTHAYLFSGPRGTGKTSIAKILAKAVNCTSPVDGEPCGKCDNCSQKGNADIIEIDAASNNGVDEIREIRDNVKYAPTNGRYKVYIIDEVHMLTIPAFNALLKTLEEPPRHVIFILATTEPHKVPLTIISRCQRYDFKRISIKDIVERMKTVLENEEATAEDNALELIARVAQGGMRDALSLLDQAISHSDGNVTLEDVISITGAVGLDLLTKTIELIHQRKTSEVLDVVNEIIEGGKEPHFFLEDLLTYYRDLVLYQTIGKSATLNKAMLDKTFHDLAQKVPSATIYAITDVLNEKLRDIRFSNQSKVLLELALVKVCQPLTTIDPLVKEQLKQEILLEIGNGVSQIQASATTEEKVEEQTEPEVLEVNQESVQQEVKTKAEELPSTEQADEMVNLSILDEVENEYNNATENMPEDNSNRESEIPEFNYNEDNYVPGDDLLTPPVEEPIDFITTVENDIKNGEDYIQIMDESDVTQESPVQEKTTVEENTSTIEQEANGSSQSDIYSILSASKKELKNEYLAKEEEVLAVLKKKKLPVFKLLSNAKVIRAVSETHMVIEYTDTLKAKMIEKRSNQKILDEVFKEVLGRVLTVKAYPTDELLPILREFTKK